MDEKSAYKVMVKVFGVAKVSARFHIFYGDVVQ